MVRNFNTMGEVDSVLFQSTIFPQKRPPWLLNSTFKDFETVYEGEI